MIDIAKPETRMNISSRGHKDPKNQAAVSKRNGGFSVPKKEKGKSAVFRLTFRLKYGKIRKKSIQKQEREVFHENCKRYSLRRRQRPQNRPF